MSNKFVVASKVKNFVRDTAGMNTSAGVMSVLSETVEKELRRALENAKKAGRKTVMDRDFY